MGENIKMKEAELLPSCATNYLRAHGVTNFTTRRYTS